MQMDNNRNDFFSLVPAITDGFLGGNYSSLQNFF